MCHNLEETGGSLRIPLCPFCIVLLWHHKQDLHLMQSTSFFLKNVIPASTVLHTISNFATHASIDDAGLCGLVTGLIAFLIGVDPFHFFALIPSENVSGACLFKPGNILLAGGLVRTEDPFSCLICEAIVSDVLRCCIS